MYFFEIGDHSVFRPNTKDAGDDIILYTSDAIQSHPKVSLTREGLFLLAILNGGDYDTVCFLFVSVSLLYPPAGRPCWLWLNDRTQAGPK
jgi:hypothetical protein